MRDATTPPGSADPCAALIEVLTRIADARDPALALTADAHRAAAGLSRDDLRSRYFLGWWQWFRYQALDADADGEAWDSAAELLTPCFVADVDDLPEPLVPALAHHAADEAERLFAESAAADDSAGLDRVVDLWRRILAATPEDNPRLPDMLGNAAVALQARHERSGDAADLEAAITALDRALAIPGSRPPEDLAIILSNRAVASHARFSATGRTDDLDEAIQLMRRSVALTPPEAAVVLSRGVNLSGLLAARFERRGVRRDLDEAISVLEEAIPDDADPYPPETSTALSNLGVLIGMLLDVTGADGAADLAVKVGRLAVATARPSGTWHGGTRHGALANLAGNLRRRGLRTGDPADLAEAVELARDAVAHTPAGHADAMRTSALLAELLCDRYERGGDAADVDDAIAVMSDLMATAGDLNPPKATQLITLGRACALRYQGLGAENDLDQAVRALSSAARATAAAPSVRVRAARQAATLVGARDPRAAAALLEDAVVLVPRIASRHLGRRDQERALRRLEGLATDAAALALAAADPPRPAEPVALLEFGRGVLLGQLLDARSDLADLRAQRPDLAERLTELRHQLDRFGPGELGP